MVTNMKNIPLAIATIMALLIAVAVEAQDRPSSGGQPRDTSATIGRPSANQRAGQISRSPGPVKPDSTTLPAGIGICLIGEKFAYITEPAQADQCDAVLWTNMVVWADNQRKLIDQSTLAGAGNTTADGETICRSCSGTCQTVSLPIKDSKYEDVKTDGGQNPSECLTRIREICESRSYGHFASARCGN